MTPQVQSFFDPATWTISHIIHHGAGSSCAIVDSVLDYDPKSGRTRFDSANKLIQFIQDHDLKTEWILETHAHADHLSASAYLKKTIGGRVAMGEHIRAVQHAFKGIFNLKDEIKTDGSQFDVLFKDNEQFQIGDLTARVMFVPGHTPACTSYIVGDAAFVGDTIFMPDVGTARCDFPGGDALQLYQSIQRLLAMPDDTKLYLCHDYPPDNEREPVVQTTVAAERAGNIHVHDGISATEFVDMRTTRDANLAMPNLILPAIQVNIQAGELPKAEDNGTRYLKIPLNVL